jgi:SPFH domain / Band 7 family
MTRITMAERPPLRSVCANCRIRLAIGLRPDRSSEGYSNARQVGKALNLVVNIDTVLSDPRAAAYEIADYLQAIDQLTVTTLRNVIGSMDLEQTLTSREEINTRLRIVLDEATGKWGNRVNRVEIKAIDPPLTIKEVLQVVWHQFGRRPAGAACVPFLLVALSWAGGDLRPYRHRPAARNLDISPQAGGRASTLLGRHQRRSRWVS